MPFFYRDKEVKSAGEFGKIDERIVSSVLPFMDWMYPPLDGSVGGHIAILPNTCPRYGKEPSSPEKYLALSCKKSGLNYEEIGLWLDVCLKRFNVTSCDGRTRQITAEKETNFRFDRRKYIYISGGICRKYLVVRTLDDHQQIPERERDDKR